MAEYTLKVRRYQPESGEGAYWEEFKVDLDPSLAVLDGILQAKDRDDGSLTVRCSCKAAIWVLQPRPDWPLIFIPQEPQIAARQEQRTASEPSSRSFACSSASRTESEGSSSTPNSSQ